MTSNLNSLGEKYTPHYDSVAVVGFAKKINVPLPNSTTPLYEPILENQTGFETNQMLKNSTTKICSHSVLSSPEK